MQNSQEDSYCTVPSPSGQGELICGRKANSRLLHLVKTYLNFQKDLRSSIDVERFTREVKIEFVNRFLKEKEVDKRNIEKMLSVALKRLKKQQKTLTHYIPCVVVSADEPKEFVIGAVHFIRMKKFLLDYKDELEIEKQRIRQEHMKLCEEAKSKYPKMPVATPTQSAESATRLVDGLTTYFSSFRWVATVTIPECDEQISRKQAELAVEAALNSLKLFFGARHDARKLRQGHVFRGLIGATASLTRETDGPFNISLAGAEAQDIFAGEDWFRRISEEPGSWYLQAASSALESYLAPGYYSELKQRFLDALTWYGQAVSEQMPSAQIIRYVAAWERVTVTKKLNNGLTKTVTRRTALLSSNESWNFEKCLKDAKEVYSWRSDLMHGTRSPFEEDLESISHLAEKITRNVLFRSLEVFDSLADEIDNPKPQDLENKYLILEETQPEIA